MANKKIQRGIAITKATISTIVDGQVVNTDITLNGLISESKLRKLYPNTIISNYEQMEQLYEIDVDDFIKYATPTTIRPLTHRTRTK